MLEVRVWAPITTALKQKVTLVTFLVNYLDHLMSRLFTE